MRGNALDNKAISSADYESFCRFLEESCGIVLGDNKHYLINSRLNRLMRQHSMDSLGQLLKRLSSGCDPLLREHTIDAMTTNETSWFRDRYPFEILKKKIFPNLSETRSGRIRIWSAACSSGQEPYSISIIGQEYKRANFSAKADFDIVATDISPTMLQEAREGVFDNMSMARGLPEDIKSRYFETNGSRWKVRSIIKDRITFREINLMNGFSSMGKFDVIFCRNVLIYFSAPLKTDILLRLSQSLKPGGYLFLGGSESVTSYTDKFEQIRTPDGLLYRKRA